MQIPVIETVRHAHPFDTAEPIHCVAMPMRVQRHRKEMLRYFVLVIALLAVILLISIALYYTQGNSVTIEHVGSLAPAALFRACLS
jgi:glucan phosphoethanolaminetransferase (alkaline phosphatase superfamily)